MTIDEIEGELKNEQLSPPDLGKFATILSGWYSYLAAEAKAIDLHSDEAIIAIQNAPEKDGKKALSDDKSERIWYTTPQGKRFKELTWDLKRIDKMMASVNRRLYVDSVAARNQY